MRNGRAYDSKTYFPWQRDSADPAFILCIFKEVFYFDTIYFVWTLFKLLTLVYFNSKDKVPIQLNAENIVTVAITYGYIDFILIE